MILAPSDSSVRNSGVGGVCMMSNKWRDEQHSSFINFISRFLNANSFRLSIMPVAPDFIFNCGGVSVAFIFMINYDCNNPRPIFSKAEKLKSQFAHLYVVVILLFGSSPVKTSRLSFRVFFGRISARYLPLLSVLAGKASNRVFGWLPKEAAKLAFVFGFFEEYKAYAASSINIMGTGLRNGISSKKDDVHSESHIHAKCV